MVVADTNILIAAIRGHQIAQQLITKAIYYRSVDMRYVRNLAQNLLHFCTFVNMTNYQYHSDKWELLTNESK